ncbi:hypothetical protein [Bosea sp. BH3]|uniref:hypothetical protein n=1 Tax=Bosea sp. BH3 TaxID=2871701 RepID=UPI0021CB83E3|nr:hypothetical protein [Bosea sp. BH3]MCU4179303.1 hypothetical protein [Bosea sp. BH3]
MERSLRIIASSLALLCGAALPAVAQEPGQPPGFSADDAFCEPGIIEYMTLDARQQAHCRRLHQARIAEMRRLSREHVARIVEENRLRRELVASLPPPPPPPVTVESFMSSDVSYGDVVVTDQGPRVFVGKAGDAPQPEDFVTLDSARSPHRGRTQAFDGAYPERRRPQAPNARRAAPTHQERQP